MLISIMHVFKTIELEFPTLVKGAEGSDHRLDVCTGILKYNIQRYIEVMLFPSPSDCTYE